MLITIPLYVILFIYLAFLVIFLILSLLNFYHIVVTGSFAMASFIMSFFIFALTILTIYFTYQLLSTVDWQQTLLEFNTNMFQASSQF